MAITTAVEEAVTRLVREANPCKIILFGSHARGDQTGESDLDFLIILPEVIDRPADMVRLQACLSGLGVPADVLVFSEQQVEKCGKCQGQFCTRHCEKASSSMRRHELSATSAPPSEYAVAPQSGNYIPVVLVTRRPLGDDASR